MALGHLAAERDSPSCPFPFTASRLFPRDDLVHWSDEGRGVHQLHETYEGMDSTSCGPCSGARLTRVRALPQRIVTTSICSQ